MPKPTGKEIADALLAARALMNAKGKHWIKGRFSRTIRRKMNGKEIKDVSYCSIGAIREVAKGNPQLRQAMVEALAESLPYGYKSGHSTPRDRIMSWNDQWNRSWSQVSRTFQAAARRARKS